MEGHPDKLWDLIAASILDACLKEDENSRVACEVLATKGNIIVAGEITSRYESQVFEIVKKVLESVGYNADGIHMDALIHKQSPPDTENGKGNTFKAAKAAVEAAAKTVQSMMAALGAAGAVIVLLLVIMVGIIGGAAWIMQREEIFQYVKNQYGTEPEYLWKDNSDAAVLRYHPSNKWYTILMKVPGEKQVLDFLDMSYDLIDGSK